MSGFVSKSYTLFAVPSLALSGMLLSGMLWIPAPSVQAAQPDGAQNGWSRVDAPGLNGNTRQNARRSRRGSTFHLDRDRLRSALKHAPRERGNGRVDEGVEWSVPMPDGRVKRFRLVETQVMASELAERFPQIKTYRGIGLDDPRELLRLDVHLDRIHAQVLSPKGNVYLDPVESEESKYLSYFSEGAQRSEDECLECLTTPGATTSAATAPSSGGLQSDGMLRVYRLALATTGEYTQFHGGTTEAGLAAIVTAVNRLNGIYESELSIRFMLVANNDQLIQTDPGTDPYTDTDAAAMLSQNQSTLDAVIGSANYDAGHVFATGGGGLAQLNSVCVAGWKARGVTGRASPVGDAFYIDYFAHEIGHQFGAYHTFNGVDGSCNANNRHPNTAYEPGSGSTLMSYSGICGSDNIQYSSDPYFHSANLIEIHNFINASSATPLGTGNTAPTVAAGNDYTIPNGTPFTLAAAGVDGEGDPLTYCWEQIDLGNAAALNGQDNGSGPLFRSLPPVSETTRVFPGMDALVENMASPGAVLPTTTRTLNFRVTARDNRVDGGAFGMDEMQVHVTTDAGPFVVLSPNAGVELSGEQTILWDVAGTDLAPVSATAVDVLLSTNGGYDYPIVLAESTANDGAVQVTLPQIYAANARIKVQACENIFFDISDVDFVIVPTAGSGFVLMTETNSFGNPASISLPASGTKGNASEFPSQISVNGVTGVVEQVTVQLHGLTHSFLDDLDILLVGPDGQNVVLLSDSSGGAWISDVELIFSDDGMEFPNVGTVTSGQYQPANIATSGDSFPVAGPYGSQLPVFDELEPNGVWSLYIVDDSTGDSGSLTLGWSLSVQTWQLVEESNQAPVIEPQPQQFVHVGSTLIVTNVALDPDGNGSVSYTLRPDAPVGAAIDGAGVLSWTPGSGLAGTTNLCVVCVTDSGTPAMTSESEIEIVVSAPPVIGSLELTNGVAQLQWSSIPNEFYRIECSDDLGEGTWVDAGDVVTSAGFTTGTTCSPGTAGQRFFRIRVQP